MYLDRSAKHQSHRVSGHHETEPRLWIFKTPLFVLGSVMLQKRERTDGRSGDPEVTGGYVRARRGGSLCQSAWGETAEMNDAIHSDRRRWDRAAKSFDICLTHFLMILHQSWCPIMTREALFHQCLFCVAGRGNRRGRFVNGQNSTIR